MPLTSIHVSSGSRCALAAQDHGLRSRDGLIIAICEEKSTLTLSPGLAAMFCCIAGESAVSSGSEGKLLRRADIHVGDVHSHHELTVASRSACLVFAGSAQAWNTNGRRFAASTRSTLIPLPATYRRNTTACGHFLRIARQSRSENHDDASTRRIRDLLTHVDALQIQLTEHIGRCPGSSLARKRAVFMRLHRARNLIEACANDDLDIARLALAANYSIGHFITLFRLVFGETPYAAISRHRLANVRCLLGESDLAVGEIAQSSGFSSPSSFTRAMKKHTGKSATQFRSALRNIA